MPLYIISFILFDLLPLPVLAIPPFCAFGLLFITVSIKFHLFSLEPDWCSFHVFNCIFMLIPWNISAFCSLDPFFLHSFDLSIFTISSNISSLGFLSLHSWYLCDFFLFISVCHLEFFIYQYIAPFLPLTSFPV